jgi:thiol-disulfide isomerase/thioredoxin
MALLVVLTLALLGSEPADRKALVASVPGSYAVVPVPSLSQPESSPPIASSALPDFPLVLYQGQDIVGPVEPRFASLLGKKPVLLNFWASNCPPCRAEMPEFERVWQRYKDRVLFVGVDIGRFAGLGDQQQSQRELKELGITYVAGTFSDADIIRRLGVVGLPSTFFITTDGRIHRRWAGVMSATKLTEVVEALIKASAEGH